MNEKVADVHASRFGAWLDHHGYSIVASLAACCAAVATLLTIGVMAIALALPLGLWVVLGNVSRLGGEVQASRDVAVFLKAVKCAAAAALADTLRARGDVAGVEVVTPKPRSPSCARPDIAAAIDVLGADAGGAPRCPRCCGWCRGDERQLAASLRTFPPRPTACSTMRSGGAAGCVAALRRPCGAGARRAAGTRRPAGGRQHRAPDIQSRREEIGVLQLLGASDGFVRRPFLTLAPGTACRRWPGVGGADLA